MAHFIVFSLAFFLVTSSGWLRAETQGFGAYLADIRSRAIAEGVSAETVDHAFAGITRDERVIGFDRRQPEFVQTFDEYLAARVTDFRRREGRRLFQLHRELLTEIGDRYQVDPEYIVAFWGLETSFGRHQGKYNIIRSLATLGHDPRRSAFFSAELIQALRILDEKHVPADKFVGAWAGAMGQSQFLPSSFLGYAQDHDGDGRKDIWRTEADVFASIANYLHLNGWRRAAGWGAQVNLEARDWSSLKPDTWDKRCRALSHHTSKLKPEEWAAKGVKSGRLLPDERYALVVPERGKRKSYLVGGNFRAILSYNCANKYAVSVGLLAEHIGAGDTGRNK